MGYHILAEATMTVHFGVLIYLILGGFLAWRRIGAIWPHTVIAAWGLTSTVFVWDCPLTTLENWSRHRAGEAGLERGFIDTYLTGVIYPERYTGLIQILMGTVVLLSWIGAIVLWRRRRSRLALVSSGPAGKSDITDSLPVRQGVNGRED
jgi:hypothetical protein